MSHLEALEAEAIFITREVVGEFQRPVLLFSGGKDSAVMLQIAAKAVSPARNPFPVMHVDTGHNFAEAITYRDQRVAELGVRLIVASVQRTIDAGRATDPTGPRASRNQIQTVTLLDAIAEHRVDAVLGGARRNEEKSRAKERIFSHRDQFGQWEPRRQRPELWSLYNPYHKPGEHIRVFPLSNWTQLDIWRYIEAENISLPPLYYAHNHLVFRRDGMLMALTPFTAPPGVPSEELTVRFRTVGDATCTGAIESTATCPAEVIAELGGTRITERGATRADDANQTDTGIRRRDWQGTHPCQWRISTGRQPSWQSHPYWPRANAPDGSRRRGGASTRSHPNVRVDPVGPNPCDQAGALCSHSQGGAAPLDQR
jgi:sulfate adenylyltransferase subunit 2